MKMDLLTYTQFLKIKSEKDKNFLWDIVRAKWLVLTPEEMVRQCLIYHLIHQEGYSKNKIGVEKELIVGNRIKRYDLLIYSEDLKPIIVVECKAPDIKLNDGVISQVVRYNQALKCEELWVVNGVEWRKFKLIDYSWNEVFKH